MGVNFVVYLFFVGLAIFFVYKITRCPACGGSKWEILEITKPDGSVSKTLTGRHCQVCRGSGRRW